MIVLLGIVLLIAGILTMGLLKYYEYRHLLGGGLIGGGIGLLSVLFPKKNK